MSNSAQTAAEIPQTSLDRWSGPVMFWLTIAWLTLVGVGLHLLNDNPAVGSSGVSGLADAGEVSRFHAAAIWFLSTAAALMPLYWVEWYAHRLRGGTSARGDWLPLLLPALRIGGRDHGTGRTQWLPGLGWCTAADELETQLERALSIPMLVVALLVLPVIAVEYFWAERIAADAWWGLAAQLAGAAIWLAFVVEFLMLISVAQDRWRFARQHWLDLAIICLPLLGFLRVLRAGRLGRLLRLNQLTKVTRTARTFRLKGLAIRIWRSLLVLNIVDRVLNRDDQKRLVQLQHKLGEAERQASSLRGEIASLRQRIAARQTAEDQPGAFREAPAN